jgi:hypothetical protein
MERNPEEKTMLAGLKTDHPRIYLTPERISALLALSRTDAVLSRLIEAVEAESDRILGESPAGFLIVGPRMLKQSQLILNRVSILGLAHLLTGDDRYARRAVAELLNASAFPHWNESHFLDTAELCNAFAIGYDWLFSRLTGPEKNAIRTALVEKGLKAGFKAHEEDAWWTSCHHSWNLVCNGGLLAGAMALADEEPDLCGSIAESAVRKLPLAMKTYAPDGGWEAGPDYWEYATRYAVFAMDSLETALGRDFGLSRSPGFSETGLFPMDCSGPQDLYFNFADSHPVHSPQPAYFWLGRKFGLSECIMENHRLLEKQLSAREVPDAFDVVWYAPPVRTAPPPRNKVRHYRGIQTVFIRSHWNRPDAVFIGFKGGSNQADHAHLDLGSFVLDASGIRWVADLGPDDYDIPGYWDMKEGGGRWRLFRLNNRSHGTLILNGDLQRAESAANVIRTGSANSLSFAVMDLSGAYAPHAASVHRGVALRNDGTAVIQDEIEWSGRGGKIRWQAMTEAGLEISGSEAVLSRGGKILRAKISVPAGARFREYSALREPPENSNEGFRLLAVDHEETEARTTMQIVFSVKPAVVDFHPLREWGEETKTTGIGKKHGEIRP